MIQFFSSLSNNAKEQINVIPVWGDNDAAPMDGGFVSNLTQQIIFSPTQAGDKVFNHHVRMAAVGSRIYLTRSTQDFREDGGGQHSWFTYSDNLGINWSAWQLLVPQGSDMYDENPLVNGVTIWPHYTFENEGKIIAIHYFVDRSNSWGNHLAVVIENGSVTDRFYLFDEGAQPVTGAYPVYTYDAVKAAPILAEMQKTNNIPWYNQSRFGYPVAWNNPIQEFSGIVNPNGFEAVLMRTLGNERYDKTYSYRANLNGSFSTIQDVGIPDCFNGSTTIWKRYGDHIYISGNDGTIVTGGTDPDYRANYFISKANYWDLNFTEAKEIVRGMTPDIQFPGTNKIGGYSYCDFVILGGKIIHAGSRGKEDIYVFTFDLF